MSRLTIDDCRLTIKVASRPPICQSSIVNRQSSISPACRAFSLAELLIAIAILGIGLLVVASMFPIAWGKARDLSQHTTAVNCTAAAEMTVKLATRVDSPAECENYTSFAGDYLEETKSDWPGPTVQHSDTFVHPLTMENILATAPPSLPRPTIPETAWLLTDEWGEGIDDHYWVKPDPDLASFCPGREVVWYGPPDAQPGRVVVLLPQRLYPELDPYPEWAGAASEEVMTWKARLETRRFCWAVFHRLNERIPVEPITPPINPAERRRAAQTPRVFTLYYVTLNRAAGQRFPQQDEKAPGAGGRRAIKALPHTNADPKDVKFPSPWLVPILMPDPSDTPGRSLNYRVNLGGAKDVVTRGAPTEVLVEAMKDQEDDFREFFPPGTWFIDHVNGEVYRVVKRRMKDDGFDDSRFQHDTSAKLEAVLTLDREIYIEDLGVDASNPPVTCRPWGECMFAPGGPLGVDPEDHRRVWVFPPAIERGAPDRWTVVGPSPAVAVDIRPLVIHPR